VVGAAKFVAARTGIVRPVSVAAEGLTPIWVAVDGEVLAHALFGDAVRAEAPAVLERLRARGWTLELLSGDDPGAVDAAGAMLGFGPDARRGGVSPEGKLAAIEALAARGPVVMVGDGVNDAAAIARASVGISMRGGAEASLAAADVYLARPGLEPLATLVDGSRATLALIRRTIALSLAYNIAGATLAVMGLVSPLVAAILMPASSISAVLLCGLGRTFAKPRP
jgi:Cu2+-exporting ATPase